MYEFTFKLIFLEVWWAHFYFRDNFYNTVRYFKFCQNLLNCADLSETWWSVTRWNNADTQCTDNSR